MERIQVLLIEDDEKHRIKYQEYISSLKSTVELYIADGETKGLELVQKFNFDAIILDLELNKSDGDGIMFLDKIKQIDLPKKPLIVVITHNSSDIIHQCARDKGADYIFEKMKRDYSPAFIMSFIRSVCKGQAIIDNRKKRLKPVSLTDDIESIINRIRINEDMLGRPFIIRAIEIVATSKKKELKPYRDVYPIIAKESSKTVDSVNRAIENAINKAWNTTDKELLDDVYPRVVDSVKGAPTNKEFIFYVAEQIKKLHKT